VSSSVFGFPTPTNLATQSNGKLERWHGTLKSEEFRDKALRNVEEARRVVSNFVTHYNEVRLHGSDPHRRRLTFPSGSALMRKTFAAGDRDQTGTKPHGVPLRPTCPIPVHGEPGQFRAIVIFTGLR
jgi:hypothetical protein